MFKTILVTIALMWLMPLHAQDDDEAVLVDIADSVITIPVQTGVSFDDVITSMKLKANMLNMKQVGHQSLHEEYKALELKGKYHRTEIFQFCDAAIAKSMLDFDINFLAYMPCRIGVIEDKNDKIWLVGSNLNILISSANLPPELHKVAEEIRDKLELIMEAGANGDL